MIENIGIDIDNVIIVPSTSITETTRVMLNILNDIDGDESCEYMFVNDIEILFLKIPAFPREETNKRNFFFLNLDFLKDYKIKSEKIIL